MSPGEAEEIACFGTRGDGKTVSALAAMIAHAQRHQEGGGMLPTRWLGAADTFSSHEAKTHESLMDALWRGLWQLRDAGHVAVCQVGGVDLVHLRLCGVEDQSGMDRMRTQCHGLWFEEPAPSSVMVQSSGLSEAAWGLGITSCRLPSYRHPKVMTLNYPDTEHWTWQRFVARRTPGTTYYRIPPGELASAADRDEWRRALASRPDMLRRLLDGQPGALMLGPQVAQGFNLDTHVRPVVPVPHATLWIGQDGGHTPTTVIGQRTDGHCDILAALSSEHAGMRQHVRDLVRPWLGEHAPWVLEQPDLLQVRYDPAIDTDEQADIEANPLRVLRQMLPGRYQMGPVSWDGRKDPMLAVLNAMLRGEPVLRVDPVQAAGLVRALDGGWYYAQAPAGGLRGRDTASGSVQPKKPNHPHEDYGDAFCYLVAGMAPGTPLRDPRRYVQAPARVEFSPFQLQRPRGAARTEFTPW